MPSQIADTLAQTISNGLRRKSIVSCSIWAEKCRVMGQPFPGNYSFKYFPWAKEMHDCDDPEWCGQKSAQVGYTEVVLNRVFYTIDIKRVDCLYLLPSQTPDASNFSASRFDSALELSPYLNDLFADVKNVGHKRAGSTNLYIRGTRSRSQLKSIPAGLIIFDELDEMTQKNLSLAEQRQAGQMYHQQIKISTPTIAGCGINLVYEESLKDHFYFTCPSCSRWTELIPNECLVITADDIYDKSIVNSHFVCKECKNILPHETKCDWLADGKWEPTNINGNYHGFHINGFYSSSAMRSAPAIAAKILKAQTDPTEEQEVYNSIHGEVHEVKGARINDADIHQCIRPYLMCPTLPGAQLITMGVDQGRVLHCEIDLWHHTPTVASVDANDQYRPKVLEAVEVADFMDLIPLMRKWQVQGCVIDANPEKRLALEFAYRFPEVVKLCYYAEGVKARNLNVWTNEPAISVDRTSWLDLSLGRFKAGTILLPSNIPEDYKKHVKEPVRVPEKDKNGNPTARYVTGQRVPDHFAHARNYSEIALNFAVTSSMNRTIKSPR